MLSIEPRPPENAPPQQARQGGVGAVPVAGAPRIARPMAAAPEARSDALAGLLARAVQERAQRVAHIAPGTSDADLRGETSEDEELETDGLRSLIKSWFKPKAAPTPTPPTRTPTPCSASATGVSLGAHYSEKQGDKYGLVTPIVIHGTELADVLDSELVGTSIDHTGSMTTRPSAKSNNSGFMPADNIPDDHHSSGISDHLRYFDAGGAGSYSRLQMDLYKIPKCGINTPRAIPNSGYRIKRTVKGSGGTKVVGVVTKTAEDVTIGSHSSTRGLTAKAEATVTLRR